MSRLTLNRRAKYDYEPLKKYEAGLVLTGREVKSIKSGGAKLDTGHIVPQKGELWLIGANISRYKKDGSKTEYDPLRSRKLLLHKKEIAFLTEKYHEKGLTLIPYSLYTLGNRIKIEFWSARGKKTFEKREKIKERDIKRQNARYSFNDI